MAGNNRLTRMNDVAVIYWTVLF